MATADNALRSNNTKIDIFDVMLLRQNHLINNLHFLITCSQKSKFFISSDLAHIQVESNKNGKRHLVTNLLTLEFKRIRGRARIY